MNLILNVNLEKKLENGDILVYSDGAWTNLPKNEYLGKLINELNDVKKDIKELKNEIDRLNKLVKELRGEE